MNFWWILVRFVVETIKKIRFINEIYYIWPRATQGKSEPNFTHLKRKSNCIRGNLKFVHIKVSFRWRFSVEAQKKTQRAKWNKSGLECLNVFFICRMLSFFFSRGIFISRRNGSKNVNKWLTKENSCKFLSPVSEKTAWKVDLWRSDLCP